MRSVTIALIATKFDSVSLIKFRHPGSHFSTEARISVSQNFGTRNRGRSKDLFVRCFRVQRIWDTEFKPAATHVVTRFPCPMILGHGLADRCHAFFHELLGSVDVGQRHSCTTPSNDQTLIRTRRCHRSCRHPGGDGTSINVLRLSSCGRSPVARAERLSRRLVFSRCGTGGHRYHRGNGWGVPVIWDRAPRPAETLVCLRTPCPKIVGHRIAARRNALLSRGRPCP